MNIEVTTMDCYFCLILCDVVLTHNYIFIVYIYEGKLLFEVLMFCLKWTLNYYVQILPRLNVHKMFLISASTF